MVPDIVDPVSDPVSYRNIVFTVTFFAGIFQAIFGLFRLGFLVDFLSHAAIVGFMAGAAIVIGLQQLKGLFGMSHFTTKTDVISVLHSVFKSVRHEVCSVLQSQFLVLFIFWMSKLTTLVLVLNSGILLILSWGVPSLSSS